MKLKISVLFRHLLATLAFFSLVYAFTPEDNLNWNRLRNNPNELSSFFSYLLMLLFFYFNYFFLVPRYYLTNKFLPFVVAVALSFVLIMGVSSNIPWTSFFGKRYNVVNFQEKPPVPPPFSPDKKTPFLIQKPGNPPSGKFQLGKSLILFLIGIFFTAALRSTEFKNKFEKEKAETELLYLKAQINPHFLFNSLNSVYSLAIEENAFLTGNALIRLSDMMRYVLTDARMNYVSLEKEMDYINSFIALQKLRFADTVSIQFEKTGDFSTKKIAPLVLIPFIENTFKYGINPEVESIIVIHFQISQNVLKMELQNQKNRLQNTESTGLGIENTRKRLNLLYENRHILLINETPTDYFLSLTLNLDDK